MIKSAMLAIILMVTVPNALAEVEMAVTVDDLPVHGDIPPGVTRLQVARTLLSALDKNRLTGVYGMVNGVRVEETPETLEVLKKWVKRGQLLGNHTYSHPDLVKPQLPDFLDNILKGEGLLSSLMGIKDFRYFRYPYLSEGDTDMKRAGVRRFLDRQHYQIAQFTVDWFDYEWNPAYVRCIAKGDPTSIRWLKSSYIENVIDAIEVAQLLSHLEFNRSIKQIMLLHIGYFEAEMMDDLVDQMNFNAVVSVA